MEYVMHLVILLPSERVEVRNWYMYTILPHQLEGVINLKLF